MSRLACLRPALIALSALLGQQALAQALTPGQQELRAVYKELVEINTTDSAGSCTVAAQAMARHLKASGLRTPTCS